MSRGKIEVPGPSSWFVSMRVLRSHAIRFVLALLVGLSGVVCPGAHAADPVAIELSLDRPIDAVASPFVMAQVGGLFSAEGLAVSINAAANSAEAIARRMMRACS